MICLKIKMKKMSLKVVFNLFQLISKAILKHKISNLENEDKVSGGEMLHSIKKME